MHDPFIHMYSYTCIQIYNTNMNFYLQSSCPQKKPTEKATTSSSAPKVGCNYIFLPLPFVMHPTGACKYTNCTYIWHGEILRDNMRN